MRVPVMRRFEPRDDRGVMAVLVGLLSLVIFGMLAFAVDAGLGYWQKRSLQHAADAAALAAAQELGAVIDTCDDVSTHEGEAQAVAAAYLDSNEDNGAEWAYAFADGGFSAYCEDGLLKVDVTATTTVQSVFGGIFGIDSLTPTRTATAAVGPAPAPSGLRPFGLCLDAVQANNFYGGNTVTFVMEKTTGNDEDFSSGFGCLPQGGMGVPGNWAVLDFNEGSNSQTETVAWTRYGYDGAVPEVSEADPWPVPGNTGTISGGTTLAGALDSIMGTPIVLPVFASAEGPGSNAIFDVVQYAGVTFCGYATGSKTGTDAECYESSQITDELDKAIWIQVKFTRVVSAGDIGSECSLGDACDTVRGVQLIK